MEIRSNASEPGSRPRQEVKPSEVQLRDRSAPAVPQSVPSALNLELSYWVARVLQTEVVREDVVEAVARRLAKGDYLTPQAAVRVAEVMLNRQS